MALYDAPRQIRCFSPTAAGRKTALAAKRLSERNAGSEGIGHLPKVQFVKPNKYRSPKKSANQPAIKNAAHSQKAEPKHLATRSYK